MRKASDVTQADKTQTIDLAPPVEAATKRNRRFGAAGKEKAKNQPALQTARAGSDAEITRTDLPAISADMIDEFKKNPELKTSETQEINVEEIREKYAEMQQTEDERQQVLIWKHKKTPQFISFLGNLFYTIGFSAEYYFVRIWRIVRDGGLFILQMALWVLKWLGTNIASVAKGIWRDITSPLRAFRKRSRQLKRVRERAKKRAAEGEAVTTYFGVGVKSSFQLALNLLGVLLPVAAVAVLVITVNNVVNMDYALAVEVDGQVMGYVSDQSVVGKATDLLRKRIRVAKDQEISDWQFNPTYKISRTDSFTTTNQLVNKILVSGAGTAGDVTQATGLFIGDDLYSVTTEGERLRAYLDGVLEKQAQGHRDDASVTFLTPVECEPNEDDVYFTTSIEEYNTLVERLENNVKDEVRYSANGEETLVDIAHNHDITTYELFIRNPELEGQEDDFVPEQGTDLLITRAQPFLQVQVSYREQSTEEVPFEKIEQENDNLMKGVRKKIQDGKNGVNEVWDDYYFVDNELIRKDRIDEMTVVVEEPVEEIYEIGTKVIASMGNVQMPAGGYGGSYIFPVPGSPYSSRGMSAYHYGMDINAPAGTPIYACEGGTVITAGWHYSYGNYVVIQHPGNVNTLYAHCSALYVSAGQQVGQGTPIGAVGSTGNSTGNHCHLEITVNGGRVNPVSYVGYPY